MAPLVGNDAPSTIRVAGADTGATKGLTLAQLQSIYECRTTNWDQVTVDGVAGGNSPIALFYPQSGSGTRAVMTDVLGFDPTVTTTSNTLCTTATAPIASFASTVGGSAVPNEENTEDGIIYQNTLGIAATGTPSTAAGVAIPAGSVAAAAIYVYSAGKFSSEWNDPADYNSTNTNIVEQAVTGSSSPNTVGNFLAGSLSMASMRSTGGSGLAYVDLTSQLGRFNQDTNRGEEGIDGSTVSEANEWYHNLPSGADPSDSTALIPGVRYVYNIADTVLPSYDGAKNLIGFDNQANGTKSVLCNGDDASTITASGFLPLTNGSGAPSGSDAAGSTCREFGGLSFPGQGASLSWTTPTFDPRSS